MTVTPTYRTAEKAADTAAEGPAERAGISQRDSTARPSAGPSVSGTTSDTAAIVPATTDTAADGITAVLSTASDSTTTTTGRQAGDAAAEPHPLRTVIPLTDTAANPLHAVAAAEAAPWRDTTAQAVFGYESVAVIPRQIVPPAGTSLTENAVFQSFVLMLAAAYALVLYRNLGDVAALVRRVSRDTASGKRLSEEMGGSSFARFLNTATAIGMLFMGVAVVKYGDSLMSRTLTDTFSQGAVVALSLLATAACAAVAAFQLAALRIAGAVILAQPFVSQLILLKRTYFSLCVLVASPALLLFALCPRGTGGVWFVAVAAELTITALLYLWETLNLFISKKISILHWFLYLCTVELFPISLLWLLAAR